MTWLLVPKGIKGHDYANMSMQITAIFHGCINGNFQFKVFGFFSYFCSKHRLWVHVRIASSQK